MAKYGFNIYGLPKYGQTDGNQLYYNARIRAYSLNYDLIRVEWDSIRFRAEDPTPTHWKLVRTVNAVPDNPDRGVLMSGGELANFQVFYEDTNFLHLAGNEVYYSIWIFNGVDWIFCGETVTIAVTEKETLTHISRRLPAAWLNDESGVGDVTGNYSPNNSLVKFLSAFVFEYDRQNAQTELIANVINYEKIPRNLLPMAVSSAGLQFEPTLGDGTNRSLYRVGHQVNATKGTSAGIKLFTSALTHWGSDVYLGINLMLDYNDSSFEESTGRWVATNGDIEQVMYAEEEVTPVTPLVDPLFPPRRKGYAKVYAGAKIGVVPNLYGLYIAEAAQAVFDQSLDLEVVLTSVDAVEENEGLVKDQSVAADTVLRAGTKVYVYVYSVDADPVADPLPTPTEDDLPPETFAPTVLTLGSVEPRYSGIPITTKNQSEEDRTYIFSGSFKVINAPESIAYSTVIVYGVEWYDAKGELISIAYSEPTAQYWDPLYPALDSWFRYSASFVAPVNTATAVPSIVINGENLGDAFAIDMLSFSQEKYGYAFEDARLIKVQVDADRINYLPNPSFDYGTGGWYSQNATLLSDRSAPSNAKIFGNAAARLITTASLPSLVSDWVPVRSGSPITFSAYVTAAQSGAKAVARIEFTTPQGAAEQLAVSQGIFLNTPYITDSDPVDVGTEPVRISVTAQSPTFVADNGPSSAKVSIYFEDASVDDIFYVDACLLELSAEAGAYFQGNGGLAPQNPVLEPYVNIVDCRWERAPQTNYMGNSFFDDASNFLVGNDGTTFSSVFATPSVSPLSGNKMLEVNRTTPGEAIITQDVILEEQGLENLGGNDLVISAYVSGYVGEISIGTSNLSDSSTFFIDEANAEFWTRIWHTTRLPIGTAPVTATITAADASSFYLDSWQLEYGRIPGKFIDDGSESMTTRPNRAAKDGSGIPNGYAGDVSEIYQDQQGSGRSYYFAKFQDKYERLKAALENIMPLGSTWKIVVGEPRYTDREMPGSLLVSPSFEKSLAGWTSSTGMTRQIGRGSLLGGPRPLHGEAWCRLLLDSGYGALTSRKITVTPLAGYYLSFGVRAQRPGTHTVSATITWYDGLDIYLWENTETLEFTSVGSEWHYFGMTAKNVNIIDGNATVAYKAEVKIEATSGSTPTSFYFDIDRVLFRQ